MIRTEAIETALKRPGRPRDESARQRILDAALEIVEEVGFAEVTTCAIAERAGVGKATVYRWWPNKAAVLIEAFREAVAPEVPFVDTGSFEADLRLQVEKFTRMLMGPKGRMLAAILAAAQNDADVAAALTDYWIAPRRAEASAALERKEHWRQFRGTMDTGLLLDVLYGPLYFRLLTGLPLSLEYANQIVEHALRALRAAPEPASST
jgi:AcrR family transcriptional regulator